MKTEMKSITSTRAAFLRGFQSGTGLNSMQAREQWDAFSAMLSDDEIAAIESGGFESGADCGVQFKEAYPCAAS